jgi:hypothetical protein
LKEFILKKETHRTGSQMWCALFTAAWDGPTSMTVSAVVLLLSALVPFSSGAILDLNELQVDENKHLQKNILLYSDNPSCTTTIQKAWSKDNPYASVRDLVSMDPSLVSLFTDKNVTCFSACLGKGTAQELLAYPVPHETYTGDSSIREFIQNCRKAEVGFISYHPTPLSLYWINLQTQESVLLDTIEKGEAHMKWHSSFLGHKFEVRDQVTNDLLKVHVLEFSGVIVIGDAGLGTLSKPVDESNIQNAMRNEWTRCNRVKRTFTELGFAKGKLPKDVWTSISTYNYNNKHNAAREEWSHKGFFVNWWEVTPYLLSMPWGLKKYWQGRLMTLVQNWIGGIPLELTDIYGIRRYEDGARLLTHVDREATHATSLIINVDQVDMREDWMVEIYDFAGRLHEISMEPGDIVYYEVS